MGFGARTDSCWGNRVHPIVLPLDSSTDRIQWRQTSCLEGLLASTRPNQFLCLLGSRCMRKLPAPPCLGKWVGPCFLGWIFDRSRLCSKLKGKWPNCSAEVGLTASRFWMWSQTHSLGHAAQGWLPQLSAACSQCCHLVLPLLDRCQEGAVSWCQERTEKRQSWCQGPERWEV